MNAMHYRSINSGLVPYLMFLSVVWLASCKYAESGRANDSLPDSVLITIRDGFDTRVSELLNEVKDLHLGDFRPSGWNAHQRYAYPRIEYATANLLTGKNIDSVNIALVEYSDYFIYNPENILHRDNFHWHSEMALRLIEMYGTNGSKQSGMVRPDTENKILEAVWLYSKRSQEDQVGANTKAEADHKVSDTWYIYESENHHSQSFCTLWHFAKLAKDRQGFKDRKYDDGRTAEEHFKSWNEYLDIFFTERAKKGIFIEMMSRDYNHKLVKGTFNVYDFTEDDQLRKKAENYISLYLSYWGQEQLGGISGGGKSRLYHDNRQGTSEYGYLYFGIGEKIEFQSTLLSAMTSSYRPPLVIVDIACDKEGRGTYEVVQRAMGLAEEDHYTNPLYHMRRDSGGIVRYSYCTPEFIIGTAMLQARPREDWALISSQNRSHGVIFANDEFSSILPQCEKTSSNRGYNSQWSVQRKGTLICQKLGSTQRIGKSMVWFSTAGLTDPVEIDGWIFSASNESFAAVRVAEGGYKWEVEESGRVEGKWLICDEEFSPVILEVDKKSNYKSFEDFQQKIKDNNLVFESKILQYTGLYGDEFTFYADYSNSPRVNGTPINYAPEMVYDSPFLKSKWNSGIVDIQKGSRAISLNFN